jgi:phenylalanyl-tRNA synthetase alpha chain
MDHPAASLSDTFFVAGRHDRVLRTETSPVQVRTMEAGPPPVYIVAPGAVYRRDDVDATHLPMFHQMEGLAVDEGLSLAHLKGTLLHVIREILGPEREIRLAPHYFPFTEPSVEVEVSWVDKSGNAGWLELLGAGMVDPNVLEAVGYDAEHHTGFAFGIGIDRVAALRHGIPDLRLLVDGDLRFLEQFR